MKFPSKPLRPRAPALWAALLTCLVARPAHAEGRELLLSNWEPQRWLAQPGVSIEPGDRRTPGAASAMVTVTSPGAAFTCVNLPPTTLGLIVPADASDVDRGAIEMLVEDAHGWTRRAGLGRPDGRGPLDAADLLGRAALDPKQGWSWRVGFFHSRPEGPFRFRGLRFQAQERKELAGRAVRWGLGPVKVTYAPDDRQWFYADLQPKTVAVTDGAVPALTLRLANLGTSNYTRTLSARLRSRNFAPLDSPAIDLGSVTLNAGEQTELPVRLPLSVLGRYEIEFTAEAGGVRSMAADTVAVVNALDKSDAYRHWVQQRRWFGAPDRQPAGGEGADADKPVRPARVTIGSADNGISRVPLFPVQPRFPRAGEAPAGGPQAAGPQPWQLVPRGAAVGPLTLVTSQLSPAWLLECREEKLDLFTGAAASGLGGPTHVAFATAGGTRVVSVGQSLDAAALAEMSQPWLLAWWQGADGWSQWDAPHLVCLQHRPASLSLGKDGVSLAFHGPAGRASVLPLYGYAKLPQQAAWEKHPEAFRLPDDPKNWPADSLRPWTWGGSLPDAVAGRCQEWSRRLAAFPADVKETFVVDPSGDVKVNDAFVYFEGEDDWKTPQDFFAPLSPTLAVAKEAGFPVTVDGDLTDLHYPTLFGPLQGVEGKKAISFTFHTGRYLTRTAEPNLTRPPDASTPSRRAQSALLAASVSSDPEAENQMWDWRDENAVWNLQAADFRDPAHWTGYTDAPSRRDRKAWLQARALHTLLSDDRYKMDERGATGLTRRYIDGPGIGNWGSADWGDSGKLGTDMIWNAWVYAFNTGDYQTIADRWDLITSLNVTPLTMTWLWQGRGAIAEMGDEAPPMLALARLAYAVGDRETYGAAAYWYARELAHHCVKEGGLTKWREPFAPWHRDMQLPTETATNLWGTNAGWMGGGFVTTEAGENQWDNFYVRLDDVDTLRFHRDHALELPRRIERIADAANSAGRYNVFFLRTALLGGDYDRAAADYTAVPKDDKGPKHEPKAPPDNYVTRVALAEREFPPKLETLIGPDAPSVRDAGFAQGQMNNASCSMVNPSDPGKALPAIRWFHYAAPRKAPGDGGDKWDFGTIAPPGTAGDRPPVREEANGCTTVYRYPNAAGGGR